MSISTIKEENPHAYFIQYVILNVVNNIFNPIRSVYIDTNKINQIHKKRPNSFNQFTLAVSSFLPTSVTSKYSPNCTMIIPPGRCASFSGNSHSNWQKNNYLTTLLFCIRWHNFLSYCHYHYPKYWNVSCWNSSNYLLKLKKNTMNNFWFTPFLLLISTTFFLIFDHRHFSRNKRSTSLDGYLSTIAVS